MVSGPRRRRGRSDARQKGCQPYDRATLQVRRHRYKMDQLQWPRQIERRKPNSADGQYAEAVDPGGSARRDSSAAEGRLSTPSVVVSFSDLSSSVTRSVWLYALRPATNWAHRMAGTPTNGRLGCCWLLKAAEAPARSRPADDVFYADLSS
jgi:hypothetical protein